MNKKFSRLLAMAIVFSFYFLGTTSVVHAKSLLDGQWMVSSSASPDFHSLWEFKKGTLFSDEEFDCNYSLSGNKLTLIFKSGEKGVFVLVKKGEGFAFFKSNGAKTAYSINPAPNGYAAFTRARKADSAKKRISLSKEALAKKNNSPFVIKELSYLLFENGDYSAAITGYTSINDLSGVAGCNIMLTATTGKVPLGVDIVQTAEVYWEANAKEHPSLKAFYERAQAVAYACAVAGEHSLAFNYQKALYQQAQRSQVTNSSEMKKAGIDVVSLGKVCDLYQQAKKPKLFTLTTL